MTNDQVPTRFAQLHERRKHRHHGIVPGLMVITFGVLLLCRELGMLPEGVRVWDFWPLLLVGFGLAHLIRPHGLGSVLVGLVVGIFGAGMLAERLGFLHVGAVHFWPLVIIAVGISILWRGVTRRGPHREFCSEESVTQELKRSVTMGGAKILVDSKDFKGGTLAITMGGMEVDLRRALLTDESAVIDVDIMMGGLEMRVPSHWQIVSEIAPFMGAVDDKTEPLPDATGVTRKLVLRGSITMGAVGVRN